MCRFLETMKYENGILLNPRYHNSRVERTLKHHFGKITISPIDVAVPVPDEFTTGVFKCRVVYSEKVERVEFTKYVTPRIGSLRVVKGDIDYCFKYEERGCIGELMEMRDGCDDIIISKNGYLTDSSFSNIALLKNGKWCTPSTPLLEGTKMMSLIERGELTVAEIRVDDLKYCSSVSLINAMLDIGDIVIDVKDIIV